ncbi:hypothetical protein M514_03770 [Trichuris suis]|uniref:Uncharacterized protein n=1 Tax=Trichuris suis TaxID=68888 RepID=A0A085MZL6_9BILA|nr:hypothetical protein M514_03770 [Trichuris suis]
MGHQCSVPYSRRESRETETLDSSVRYVKLCYTDFELIVSEPGDLVWRATEPLTAVRQLFNSLLSSIPSTKELADIISNYRPHIKEYNTYRHIGAITWSALACAASLFLFAFAVLLLFVFGPEGGCCHFRVPEKCIKKLLALSVCIAYWTALLGSVMFLVFFTVGANVHNACQRLEDVEGLNGFIGTFSNVTNDYLRWLVNSSFVKSGDISSTSLFDAHEMDTVIKAINATDIVQKCKERKTVFVILNWNSLNLTAKLTNMFSASIQALRSRRKRRSSSLLRRNQGPLGALSRSSYEVQDEGSESLRRFSGASSGLPFGGGISLPQSAPVSHQPQAGKRSAIKLAKNSPFSKLAGRMHGNTFEMTKRTESSAIKLKQPLPQQETGWPHFAEYEIQNARLHLRNGGPVDDRTKFGRSLSRRHLDFESCNRMCTLLRRCNQTEPKHGFSEIFGCLNVSKARTGHAEHMATVIDMCDNITRMCNAPGSSNPSKAELLKNVPTYARRISGAFENDILPCDALTYFVRSAFNSTCRDAFRRINCWNVAVGLWCLLAAFTVCFGMSTRKMLLGSKPQKTSESTSSSISL